MQELYTSLKGATSDFYFCTQSQWDFTVLNVSSYFSLLIKAIDWVFHT